MITPSDKETLKAIYQQLVPMPPREGAFTGMENLFYSALQVARHYGSDGAQNGLLRDFIEVKDTAYSETQKPFHKQRQRELTIVHFKAAFKKKLGSWIR